MSVLPGLNEMFFKERCYQFKQAIDFQIAIAETYKDDSYGKKASHKINSAFIYNKTIALF